MEYLFLGESKLLIGLGMVAIAAVCLGIMLRKRKLAPKDKKPHGRH